MDKIKIMQIIITINALIMGWNVELEDNKIRMKKKKTLMLEEENDTFKLLKMITVT